MSDRTPPFRRATADDAPVLEALQRRSSTHWGYPPDYFDWAPGALSIPSAYVSDNPVYVLEQDGKLVGFYGLTKQDSGLVMDKLFVDRDEIGKGYGRLLWRHAVEIARTLGYRSLEIGSDPNAAPFYAAMGATWLSARHTANPEWTVQLFRYAIPEQIIRPARIDEAQTLHELTQRSVMYWGYPPEFLQWEPESIAVTTEFMQSATAVVLEIDGQVTGYYALVQKPAGLFLDKLFVDPTWIGTGQGKRLWQHAVQQARALGATSLHIDADPNAAPFYQAMGATWVSEIETTWPDWRLQVFEFPLGIS